MTQAKRRRAACLLFPLAVILGFASGCADSDVIGEPRPPCLPDESAVAIHTTESGLRYVRTPEERFADLPGFPFEPHYRTIDGLRMHYIDEGPADGEIILLLHGQPSWSYLYRKMITSLAGLGRRVIAVDFVGLGRSDKPIELAAYTYDQHTQWAWRFIQDLDLQSITLFGQDWGGLIGLRIAGEHPERFARIVAANTMLLSLPPGANPFQLPTSTEVDCSLGDFEGFGDFDQWIEWAMRTPTFRPSQVVESATEIELSASEARAYDAPYPSRLYTAAIRRFPAMVAEIEEQASVALAGLAVYDKPFLTLFGALDPVLGSEGMQNALIALVPGARGPHHDRFAAQHFLQEDVGVDLGEAIHFFMMAHPAGRPVCWVPPEPESVLDCVAVCDHVFACNPEGFSAGFCRQTCGVVQPYLTLESSSGVMPCLVERECENFTNFGQLLDGCMPTLFPTLTIAPGNAEACATMSAAISACDPESIFAAVCSGLSFVLGSQTVTRMSECSAVSCDEMRACFLEANCMFTFDQRGAIPRE
ncbi:MAG: haloalkane dehalogenase [Deltaproteobacteria bacterium]